MTVETTVIRNLAWLVAWDGERHVYLNGADLAFRNGTVIHAGADFAGSATREIDGGRYMAMPGLVNIHTHSTSEPLRKGLTDDCRSPGFWNSSLYEYLPAFANDADGARAALQVAMAELLLSGTTTVVDLSPAFDGWLDELAATGIRACIAPMFRDARWRTPDGHSLVYEWDEAAGERGLETAMRLVDLAGQHRDGRLFGMMAPAQIDTCTPGRLQTAHAHAASNGLAFQIHAAQSMTEFLEMTRRHGLTPIQWMDSLGILTRDTIVAHTIFLDHHPWLHWPTETDLDLVADRGATVAHCPTVFARRGFALQSLGRYLRRGINVGIGTDTFPHNMLEEMRTACTVARLVTGQVDDVTTGDVLHAATVAGAKALRRPDLGRLATGARADIVLIDLECPAMRPLHDPLRNLITVAADRAVAHVFIDGEQVVRDRCCLTVDLEAASLALDAAQARARQRTPGLDWAGRAAADLAPLSLPRRAGL